jgi:uncharacterized membrane protein
VKPTTRDGILRGGTAATVRLLLIAAAGVSAYLLSLSLSGGSAVGCGPGSACDEVLQSRWAYVLGIPVSALALAVDLTLLLATFTCGRTSSPKQRRGAWEILVPCSILVLGAALWFVALQAFVLHRFCPWCMTAHVCSAVAATLLLVRVPITDSRAQREKEVAVLRSMVTKMAVAAVAAIALLGVAQVAAPRKTYSVATVSSVPARVNVPVLDLQANNKPPAALPDKRTNTTSPASIDSSASIRDALTNSPSAAFERFGFFQILGGRALLDLKKVPLWGPSDAPTKLVSLYDYTCHHCRDMHPHVVGLRRTFGDKLAIVSLPVPLDARCNYLLRGTQRPHMNACEYAKLGLIVWRAKRDAIQPFDDWLFSFQNPPPLVEVTNKVVDMVGLMAFDSASRDPWIEQQLKTDIDIYAISGKEFSNGAMPQFMIGSNVITGILTPEQLQAFVAPYVQSHP